MAAMSEALIYGDGCEQCEYTPGAYYRHADDCGDDEDGTPNLCSGSGVHETDCRGEWLPCPGCSPEPEKTTGSHAERSTR